MRGLAVRAGITAGVAALAAAASAPAATLEVTRTGDPVPDVCKPRDCSLREAVRRANATAADDRIVLKARNYKLTRVGDDDTALAGDLDVLAGAGRLTIVGKGRGKTAIDGNDVDRILDVLPEARLSIAALSLKDGSTPDSGGAIDNEGQAAVRNVAVRSSFAGVEGGGINNTSFGNLRVRRSVIAGNTAVARGGGVHSRLDGVASIARSKIIGNRADGGDGGGVVNQNDARMRISRSSIVGNRALDDGGGIFNQNDARLAISRSTISGNRTLDDQSGPVFARGGGIFNQNNAVLHITGSTISGNRSPTVGGAIFTQNDAVTTLTNSTISGNRADEGGGIHLQSYATVTLRFSTIARNRATTGGGIFEDSADAPDPMFDPLPPYVIPRGTIIAGNAAGTAANCLVTHDAYWASLGGNLESGDECELERASDRRNAVPGLRKLARNGGPTKTHALKRSSDAVNAARKKGCPKRDQRGVKRPQGRRCDVGSYELKKRR